MNDSERLELEQLRQRQAQLLAQVASLSRDLDRLQQQWTRTDSSVAPAPPVLSVTEPIASIENPPLSPTAFPQPTSLSDAKVKPPVAMTSKAPLPASAITAFRPEAPKMPAAISEKPAAPPRTSVPVDMPLTSAMPGPPPAASFEMRLGTFWFVRIGAVLVLTGLVFFGNLAFQKLGPAGKTGLLYLASGVLLGAGAWWQRKEAKESLQNYAQVLFAGGLAAVYFTTYAAHHFPTLRIIGSPVMDGALLLWWAGFMVWVADRKRSQPLALFAVGLAYYSAVITRVGTFTLWSNLVLAIAAIFFLVRHRWAVLSYATLAATYAAYAWWRFIHGFGWHWASPEEGLWLGASFLGAYWVIFTAAVFLSRSPQFAGPPRAAFLTLNNAGFFVLFVLTMWQVRSGGFWKLALTCGVVLLALTALAGRILAEEPLTRNAYLTQGLLLVTVAFIAKFSGLNLALVLGVESVTLLTAGLLQKSRIQQAGAFVTATLAAGWVLGSIDQNNRVGLGAAVGLSAMFIFNTFMVRRAHPARLDRPLLPQPAYFAALAIGLAGVTTWVYHPSPADCPLLLVAEAVLLTLSLYVLRIPELPLLGQSLALVGHVMWQGNLLDGGTPRWWNPVLMLGLTLGLGHWWQRQQSLKADRRATTFLQFVWALALVGLLLVWGDRTCADSTWLGVASLLAVGVTVYAAVTRAWMLAACAQLFLLPTLWLFCRQVGQGAEPRYIAFLPILALGLLSFATVFWFREKTDARPKWRDPLLKLAMGYRWVALVMGLWWVLEYVPARERIWGLSLIGVGLFALAGWRRSHEALLAAGVFSGGAFLLVAQAWAERTLVYLPNLLAILAWLIQQRVAQHWPGRYAVVRNGHGAMIVFGGVSLWALVSHWVAQGSGGFYLTASWSVLALLLLAVGMVLHERMYRWLGLAVLAAALGRIVIFDVWKLETNYRVLSFLALGIVLIVLGYVYTRYQDKIREWL